jgi:exonuclease SbcC
MRIRKVTAHAFGPLVRETLEFADGMTVVVGDNESAKSSWHAAIYAALCGRRRGPGKPRKDEQRFIDLHKPWDGDD